MNTVTDFKVFSLISMFVLLTACHQLPHGNKITESSRKLNIAEQFLLAYNQHNEKQMLNLVHPEIKYMYIEDEKVYTETSSKAALAKFLDGYFQNNPRAASKMVTSNQHGRFIHQVEQALWKNESGQQKSQCSLSVYETNQQLIINVWYFNAYACDEL